MKNFKLLLWKQFERIFFNYSNPRYSYLFYFVAKNYCKFYENNENADCKTNGENYFIANVLKLFDPHIIFDIGSNNGNDTEFLVNSYPEAVIHCFEPDKRMFTILNSKFKSNKKVILNNIGLSEYYRKSKFYLNDDPGLNSVFDMNNLGYRQNTIASSIKLETLNGYSKRNNIKNIDFVKMDVEGSEYSVLKGGIQLLYKNRINIIQFEYGSAAIAAGVFFKNIYDLFSKCNYTVYKIMPKGLLLQTYSPYNEHIVYANYVALSVNIALDEKYLIKRPDIYRQ